MQQQNKTSLIGFDIIEINYLFWVGQVGQAESGRVNFVGWLCKLKNRLNSAWWEF